MSENVNRTNWMVILTVLFLIGMVIAGPYLTGQIGPEAQSIELKLPIPINGSSTLALTTVQAVIGLVVLIVGAVGGTGTLLSFIFLRTERGAREVLTSDTFQTKRASLEKQEIERIKQLSADRHVYGGSDHHRPRWSAISTSLVVILFAIFLGMLINYAFIPNSEYVVNGRTASAITVTLIWLVFISLFVIILRNQMLKARDSAVPISWDSVWITASGLIVVGVGLSLLLYFSGNPDAEVVINSAVPVAGGIALISMLFLAWSIQPQDFTAIGQTDNKPIPWDFIWVLLSGLLVVGLGLAITAYLNSPF